VSNLKAKFSPALVVGIAAISVVLVSIAGSFTRRIGLVEPHVWIRSTASKEQSIEKLSRTRALENTLNGEVSHTAERMREATVLAVAASLCAVNQKASGRPFQTVDQLLIELKDKNLLPPGLDRGSQSGTVLSSNGTLSLRYRLVPFGIEVLSLGADKTSGPALIVRIPVDRDGNEAAAIFVAEKLEAVVIPYAFAPSSEVIATGWERQRLPEQETN